MPRLMVSRYREFARYAFSPTGEHRARCRGQFTAALVEDSCTRNSNRCMALLQLSKITLSALKPNDIPKELSSLGDHLKKRRLTSQQFQKEVSLRLGINEWTYH